MSNKNTVYISDEKKQNYYMEYWCKICKEANASKETSEKETSEKEAPEKEGPEKEDSEKNPEDEFMDILISEMADTENRKTIYKQNCNKEEITVIVFAFFSAVFSGLLSIWDNEIWKYIFSALGVLTSAAIAAINSYRIWKSTKESWLRCSSYRAKLSLEADEFCDNIGKYGNLLSARQKIDIFKENINILRREDYSKFFVNMGSDFSYKSEK